MSKLNKARLHSVNENGTILENVDVYTSGDAVTLNNDKTLEDIYANEIGNVNKLNTQNKKLVDAINEVNAISSDLLFQTAGGTSNALTLAMQPLTNGYTKTFIASSNNEGTTTTVNGKLLYKPNTTTPPNLTKGKAYTLWYDSANDCFFTKASAEGNVVAEHVLAGDGFSNDSDTNLIGTMPNYSFAATKSSYTSPSSIKADGSGNLCIAPKTGYYTNEVNANGFGEILLKEENFISPNIRSDQSMFGLKGTMPNNGAFNRDLNCGQSFNIPSGYTTGGKINSNSLASQTSANADESKILKGFSAWVNGREVDGDLVLPTIQSLGGKRFYTNSCTHKYYEDDSVTLPFTAKSVYMKSSTGKSYFWCWYTTQAPTSNFYDVYQGSNTGYVCMLGAGNLISFSTKFETCTLTYYVWE